VLCGKALGSVVGLIKVEVSVFYTIVLLVPKLLVIVAIVIRVATLVTISGVPVILVTGPTTDVGFHERVEVRVFEHSAFSLGVGDDARILQSIIDVVK
jgi:hypothetical protein